jgi:hypothetical protein
VAFGSIVATVLGPIVGADGFASETGWDDVPGFERVIGEGA